MLLSNLPYNKLNLTYTFIIRLLDYRLDTITNRRLPIVVDLFDSQRRQPSVLLRLCV